MPDIDTDELRERAQLLETIAEHEDDAEWTDLDELRERARLLSDIQYAEDNAEWTDLDELQERAKLHRRIAEHVE